MVDRVDMSETTAGEVEDIEADPYRDWPNLEAELQQIARSKTSESSPSPGFWAKRRRKG